MGAIGRASSRKGGHSLREVPGSVGSRAQPSRSQGTAAEWEWEGGDGGKTSGCVRAGAGGLSTPQGSVSQGGGESG